MSTDDTPPVLPVSRAPSRAGASPRFKVIALVVLAGMAATGFGLYRAFASAREESKIKAMIPRQPMSALDQFFVEEGLRIFVTYAELIGPDRIISSYHPVDGEDLSAQFPLRRDCGSTLAVQLPDGTTVNRTDALAVIGQSGLVVPYPPPEGGLYNRKRVYRLNSGISFRNFRVVDRPPDPEGREGRDQDGIHRYQLPGGSRFEVTYRGGVPDGLFRAFYADGKPWGEATYRQGKVVAAQIITPRGRRFDELNDGAAASAALREEAEADSTKFSRSGRGKLAARDYAGAAADFTAAINSYPTGPIYLARADARAALGDFAGAIEDAKRARDCGEVRLGEEKLKELYTRQARH